MVRIRLRRMGSKKKPFYRIVIADKRSPRDGRFIETIGTYDPMTEPATVDLKLERAAHWLSVGAQPTEAVARLLVKANLLDEAGKAVPFDAESVVEAVADAVEEIAAAVEETVAEAAEVVEEAVEEAAEEAEAVADAAAEAG